METWGYGNLGMWELEDMKKIRNNTRAFSEQSHVEVQENVMKNGMMVRGRCNVRVRVSVTQIASAVIIAWTMR